LGEGEFAKVYKGTYMGTDVAIKTISMRRHLDDPETKSDTFYSAEMEQVRNEALVMKLCSVHANVVDIYGYSMSIQKDSNPILIMQLMRYSLHKLIHNNNSIELSLKIGKN
jgi:serine/threonine protein kinase